MCYMEIQTLTTITREISELFSMQINSYKKKNVRK